MAPAMSARIDTDAEGYPYRSGEIVALDLDPAGLERVRELGFLVVSTEPLDGAGRVLSILRGPADVRGALTRLRTSAPSSTFAPNHLFGTAAGSDTGSTGGSGARGRPCACRIGMIDTGLDPAQLSARPSQIVQKSFGGPSVTPQAHGATVAGVLLEQMAGRDGLPPGATVYVADVFSSGPQSGSAAAIVRALSWMAGARTPVINISLTGPPNAVVGKVVDALVSRGVVVVAAAGNDGPAAPPVFPAAYPGVVAVTAVDAARRPYRYANRGPYVAFSALAVNVAAGKAGQVLSGTSYASPVVAVELARRLPAPDREAALRAELELRAQAVDLGRPGRDPVFGFGLIEPRP
jgi:subtilisin family serine protease